MDATPANIRFAMGLRNEIIGKIERGTFVYADYFPRSPMARKSPDSVTVGQMLDAFKAECDKAVRSGTLAPSTVDSYRKNIESHLKPAFGSVRLRELDAPMIRDFIRGLDLTAKTIKNILVPLSQMLDEAVNDDLIPGSPMARVSARRLIDRNAKASTYEVDPFTPEEVAAILAACTGQSHNLIAFAFETGLRTSELIALRWEDVDLDRHTVYVRRAVVDKIEKSPKTYKGSRRVDLTARAQAALEAQKQWTLLPGRRVFHNASTGREFNHDQQIRKSIWTPILERANVRYRNPYQTRHTFASANVSRGCNLYWLKDQMGHETLEMIQKHYAKWMPEYNNERPQRSAHP